MDGDLEPQKGAFKRMDPPWKGSDSDSTDVSEIKETYDAENLLAEKFDSGSRVKKYLVKWQDYPIDR